MDFKKKLKAFLHGMALGADPTGVFGRLRHVEPEDATEAWRRDWERVGADLWKALRNQQPPLK